MSLKKFPFFEVERVSSFFIEPQYAVCFAFNLLIISRVENYFQQNIILQVCYLVC